jgi:hypothetical protein
LNPHRRLNEVSRIGAMCRSAERSVLVSSAFAAALLATERDQVDSVNDDDSTINFNPRAGEAPFGLSLDAQR